MIPKIVHFIWFGGNPYPKKIQHCIDSWHKRLPDYEFKLWNEESFDVNSIPFTKQAYENKKWAFVSDYVRLYALYNYGGWYLDTDVEVLKSLDPFSEKRIVLGTDEDGSLTALMGSEKEFYLWKKLLQNYENISFINDDGSFNQVVNNHYIEDMLREYGFTNENKYQELSGGIEIYPDDYFHAVSFMKGTKNITKNTYAIHWHTVTWTPRRTKVFHFIRTKIFLPLFGTDNGLKLIYSIRQKLGIGDKK